MAGNFWFTRRTELGLSQFELAVAAGCTPSAIAAWENEKVSPRLKNAPKLAPVYRVSVERIEKEIVASARRVEAQKQLATSK